MTHKNYTELCVVRDRTTDLHFIEEIQANGFHSSF